MEHAVAQNAGVVDDTVQPSEVVDGGPDHALRCGGVGDAFAIGYGAAAFLPDHGNHFGCGVERAFAFAIRTAAQVIDHHRGALPGREQGDLAADAASRTGHKYDFPFKNSSHFVSSAG
ncbi:hypothetical protein D9M68_566680 [compost metagenome]